MKSNELTQEFVDKYILTFIEHNDDRRYIDTKRFSPVIYENDLPHEGDLFHINPLEVPYSSEAKRNEFIESSNIITDDPWWEIQAKRCREGYVVKNATNFNEDVWIPGRMYWFLNFWPIKLAGPNGRKILGNPRFIDAGFEKFFLVREYSVFMQKNNMWQKRRQFGLSEMAASDVAYEFTWFPNSQSVIVSGEEKYTFNFMNFVTRGLKHLSNTQFHIQVDTYRPKEYIKAKYTGCEIYGRTAMNNAEAVSSLSPSLIYFEEDGIWQKGLLQKAYDHVKVSLIAESDEHGKRKKTGWAYLLGTGGDMEKGVSTVQKMFYDPKGNDLLEFDNKYEKNYSKEKVACFIPAFYFYIVDTDGNSLVKISKDTILKERETMSAAARYTNTTAMPLTPSESFLISTAGYFGPQIIGYLNERKTFILSNKTKIFHQRGYLQWIDPTDKYKGVEFVESEEHNWCHILEHPRIGRNGCVIEGLYKGGVDSYDQNEAHTSTSEGSIQIWKTFNNIDDTYNKYVARITERPTEGEGGANRWFEWALMLSVYYNAITLIEYTKFLIVHYYTDNGFEYLLKERPEFFLASYVDDSKASNRYGIDASTKSVWLTKMRDALTVENINKMDDIDQIEALAMFRYNPGPHGYNCDITISSSLCQILAYDEQHIGTSEDEDEEEEAYGISYKMHNGNIVQTIL